MECDLYLIYSSFVLHLYFISTLSVPHLLLICYLICFSSLLHLYVIYISCLLPLCFTYNSLWIDQLRNTMDGLHHLKSTFNWINHLKKCLRHRALLWMWYNRRVCSDYKKISSQWDDFTLIQSQLVVKVL